MIKIYLNVAASSYASEMRDQGAKFKEARYGEQK